jgi:hypothetical protein
MRNTLANTITIILILLYFLPFILSAVSFFIGETDINLNPFDYARITDVDYKAILSDSGDGSALIKERITFDIHAASKNNLFWELWRDLPEEYTDELKVDYTVHSVKQILDDGTVIPYEESDFLYWDDSDFVNRSW